MADGTTAAPAPSTEEERASHPVPEMVPIQFTNKYDRYSSRSGPQFNAGELASLPKDEAERLIGNGAAVRQSESTEPPAGGKASVHPNKMQKDGLTK